MRKYVNQSIVNITDDEMFRCTLASLLDSIVRGFCVYNIVLFCTHSQLHMVYITTTATIGGHATFGKPKRFRQT